MKKNCTGHFSDIHVKMCVLLTPMFLIENSVGIYKTITLIANGFIYLIETIQSVN